LCEDCLSFAVVAAEFWSFQKKCGSQRTNGVRQTLGRVSNGDDPAHWRPVKVWA